MKTNNQGKKVTCQVDGYDSIEELMITSPLIIKRALGRLVLR